MTPPTRVVFLGSGGFAVPTLDALAASPDVALVSVVSTPPRPAGRRAELRATPVAAHAAELGLPVLLPEQLRHPAVASQIAALTPDLLVLADYGRIVPAALLELAPNGALNLHPSLLPRHRGATPIPSAIAAGDAETGVSLIRMDVGVDTGPIVAQRVVPLSGLEDAPGLEALLAQVAARLLLDSMDGWIDGSLKAVPQPQEGATVTRLLRREDGRLEPTRTAAQLDRQVRAFRPWPGTFLDRPDGRILVWDVRPSDQPHPSGASAGDLVVIEGQLALVTGAGVLDLMEVQPAGGRRMAGIDLARGRPALLAPGDRASAAIPGSER